MQTQMYEMVDKVSDVKWDTTQVIRQKCDVIKKPRLEKMKALKKQLETIQGDLSKESHARTNVEKMTNIRYTTKTEKILGRQGCQSQWPLHVYIRVCKIIVCEIPPAQINRTVAQQRYIATYIQKTLRRTSQQNVYEGMVAIEQFHYVDTPTSI